MIPVIIQGLPDGNEAAFAVIDKMREVTKKAYQDERISQLARKLTMRCPARDRRCEASTILRWMQGTFRYTYLPFHPDVLQRIQTPSYTLFDSPTRSGECASLTSALAALLTSLGAEVRFRLAGSDLEQPDRFEHVYLVVNVDGQWVPAEPSYSYPFGWESDEVVFFKDFAL